jgi:hypothetical protein
MIVDAYLTYQFVRRFVSPFKNWRAYALGIIDEEGNVLKKRSELTTAEERAAFGTFDLLVLNVKKWTGSKTNVLMPAMITAVLMKENHTYQEVDEVVGRLLEDEGAPTNNVGDGAVAGLGVGPQGEPGKKKNRHRRLIDVMLKRRTK